MRSLSLFIVCLLLMACNFKSKKSSGSNSNSNSRPAPVVSIDTESLVDITTSNIANFIVSGTCSENGQPVNVAVGEMTPETTPTCSSGNWEIAINLTSLTGASRDISIIADHSSSGGLVATTATTTVKLYPRVSINVSVTDITDASATTFVVSGTCSENGQPITVVVGSVTPETAPTCTTGIWTTEISVSELGAAGAIAITADHQTSGSSSLEAMTASKTVTLYPRVAINASVTDITDASATTFVVSGTCSENGQPVTVVVGSVTPETAPTCSTGTWTIDISVSELGAAGAIAITADHQTSGSSPLEAMTASKTVTLYPRVAINASVTDITDASATTFVVSGTCSESGQPVTVVVGSVTPETAPTCTTGAWTTDINISRLGVAGSIAITADHQTSGSSSLEATTASKTVTLYPRVAINASVTDITDASATTFVVSGTCSENGQPVTVVVGSVTPSPSPTCSTGTWTTDIIVSELGSPGSITITADHQTSGSSPLEATTASKTVTLYPRVAINASVTDITDASATTFVVSGTCSESGQPVTVVVGSITPLPAPTCSTGTWTTDINISQLGAAGSIAITADHQTSGSNPLDATTARKTVTLYPRVAINASVTDITDASATTFVVSGTCSESGQPVTVVVGSITPSPAPTCTTGAWTTDINISQLGVAGSIAITADHQTSGSNPLDATTARKTVTLYPRVTINASLGNITGTNISSFRVNGTCSENGRPITVRVGSITPSSAPTCTTGAWSVEIDVSGLGASGSVTITADHQTSGGSPLEATTARKTVTLYPRVTINASVTDITDASATTFVVSGTCSENGQPVTVVVGSVTPSPSPTCSTGTWTTDIIVSELGSPGSITITADHQTSGSNPLEATTASKTVTLYPRVAINASVTDITDASATTFVVSGTCSENGQPVTVVVGSVTPLPAPTCTTGAWTTDISVSELGAAGSIAITADHQTSGSNPLEATTARKTVTLYPRVTVASNLIDITPPANVFNYRVSGTCSENGQPVEVSVGGIEASPAPTCSTGNWTIDMNVTGLTGGSRDITITADHTSGSLEAIQATSIVTLYPRVTITSSPSDITSANISNLRLSGDCSENGQQVLVAVDTIAASPLPTCMDGSWSTDMDATGLGASGPIFIRAGHLSSEGLEAIPATRNLTLHPRVYIASNLESITINNLSNFVVSGTCSENGRFVIVRVDSGISPATPPTCTDETWTTIVDVSSLGGAPRMIDVTADHTSSIGQPALRATKSVAFNLNISIIAETITASNAANFRISGNCSENGQPVEVSVSTTISPDTDPTCTNESWEVTLDVTGLNKMGTVNITATHSPDGGPAYPQATKSVTNSFICPENYVGVPSLASYTTNSFCLMKYEAKNDGSDGAISQASELPYGNISRNDSIDKCMAIGDDYDLTTNDEWQSLARNIESVLHNWIGGFESVVGLSRGHSDNTPPERLAASSDDNQGCFGTGQNCSSLNDRQQRRTFVLSNGEIIWDISGNIYEWVKDTNNTNYGQIRHMALVTATTHPTVGSLSGGTTNTARRAKEQFGPSGNYSHFSGSPFGGMGTGALNSDAGAIIRGGDKEGAGVFTTYLHLSETETRSWVGFRCTYHPPYE